MKAMFNKPTSVITSAAHVTQLRVIAGTDPKKSDHQHNEIHIAPVGSGAITAAYGNVNAIMRLIGALADIGIDCLILVE